MRALIDDDEYVLTPRIGEESYIDFLLDYCKKNNITAIISRHDWDLVVLSKNKDRFKKNGISLIVSDEQIVKICRDKWLAHQFLSSIGLKQPRTYIDMELLKQDLRSDLVSFPMIMKPRCGNSSYSLSQIDDFDELDVLYRKTVKNIFNSYLKYESADYEDSRCVIVQEKIDGDEYGLDILNDMNGSYVTHIAKKKLSMRMHTLAAEIVDSKPFDDLAKAISYNLRHIGNLDIDFFITDSGDIYVIDLNCRFGGQYNFSHLAGANFPKQIIDWLMGLPTLPSNINVETGVRGERNITTHIVRY